MRSKKLYNNIMSRVDKGLKEALLEGWSAKDMASRLTNLYNDIDKTAWKKNKPIKFFEEGACPMLDKEFPELYKAMKDDYLGALEDLNSYSKQNNNYKVDQESCMKIVAAYSYLAYLKFLQKNKIDDPEATDKRGFYNHFMKDYGLGSNIIKFGIKKQQVNLDMFMDYLERMFEFVSGTKVKKD